MFKPAVVAMLTKVSMENMAAAAGMSVEVSLRKAAA